jgi:hypothetical protein
MIGYCPLDEEPIERPLPRQEVSKPSPQAKNRKQRLSFLGDDDTECNYVVMFFIAGVIALAIMDSLPNRK